MLSVLKGFAWAIAGLVMSSSAGAVELGRHDDSHSSLVLHSELLAAPVNDQFWLALEIEPRDGWHTYWKNPGDSGASIILEWGSGTDARFGEPVYETPHRIPYGPLLNYGYEGTQTLLVPVTTSSQGLSGRLEAEWLVCDVECVPQIGTIDFQLPAGEGVFDPSGVDLFAEARDNQPDPSYWAARLEMGETTNSLLVFMDQQELTSLQTAYFFPESEGVVSYSATQEIEVTPSGLALKLPRPAGAPTVSSGVGLLALEFNDGTKKAFHLEPMLKVAAEGASNSAEESAAPAPLGHASGLPIWQAILFALVGGLILNLMPCVFPVLSLKAFAFVSANYRTAASRQREGWAYTLGIWISFMVIVGILLALRAGGSAIGWGFQLQEPLFVALMAVIMLLVALSLSGLFNISFGVEGAGQELAAREGLSGAFFKGVLAALVATPCTAPFMAPAIGFALTQPVVIVLLIFSSLAFGLALPFLLLSYSPALARMMPKPGLWMEKLKQGLAFPMYLTAVWLIYVFDRGVGPIGTFVLLAAMVGIVFAIWLWQQGSGPIVRSVSGLAAAFAVLAVVNEPWVQETRDAADSVREIAYTDATLRQTLQEGTPVFAYFTADWCITCKVNERVAVFTETTQSVFKERGVTMVKGDWTNRNEEIAQLLAKYGRAGVPLYLYFPADQSEPTVLPEVLGPNTIAEVVSAS